MKDKKKIEKLGFMLAMVCFVAQIISLYTYKEVTRISNLLLTFGVILIVITAFYKYRVN